VKVVTGVALLFRNTRAALVACAVSFLTLGLATVARADISINEGQPFSGKVGSFNENCPQDPENHSLYDCDTLNPSATITWGDGSKDTATLTKKAPNGGICTVNVYSYCIYTVSGAHTYTEAGTYSAGVDWTDSANFTDSSGSFTFNANIADVPITLSNASITRSGQKASLTATLTDDNPDAGPCDYTVTIDWGDGQQSSGLVNNNGCIIFAPRLAADASTTSSFSVTGSHTYAAEPSADAAVTATDNYGNGKSTVNVSVPRPARPTTEAATNIGQSTATLRGYADTQGAKLQDCHFEWGTTRSYGNTIPCTPSAFTAPQEVTAALSGLNPNTSYHYQLVVTTDVGTVGGGDQGFTTLSPVASGAPTVTTGGGLQVTKTSATIDGFVNPNGQTVSDCHFEWGTTTSYGNTIPCSPPGLSGTSAISVTADLAGLSPDTTYHFRVVAANAGAPPSAGADATFTTLPTCDVDATFGYVDATGCFSHSGGTYKSTPGTVVKLDGLTLTPDHPWTTITIDPSNREVIASGAVSVNAGTVTVYDGTFTWTEPDPHNALSAPIGAFTPPPLTKVAGILLAGNLSLSFNKQKGADLKGDAVLPLGSLAKFALNATLELHTALGQGLLANELTMSRSSFSLPGLGIGVKNLKVVYAPDTDTWEGGAEVSLPTPNKLDIAADLAFQNGEFHKFAGSVDNIDFPIIDGVYLQRISVVFAVNPTEIGGGLGLSFGPTVDGNQLVRVDGNFIYQAATSTAAGFVDVGGSLTLASFKIANAYFDYYTTGMVAFGGHAQLGLPDSSSSDPENQPVYIDAGLDGALDGSSFDMVVHTTVALNFIDLSVGADILVSDKGLAACAKLSAFGFTWSPGVGYTWATGDIDLMAYGCSLGPWQTLPLGEASAAAGSSPLRLRPGRSVLELKGVTGAPLVTLTGPHGQHVSVPTGSVRPLMVPGFMVLQDPADKTTWIAVQRGGGRWRIALEPGSSAIASIRDSGLLPDPRITGRVSGKGGRRTLKWHLRPIAGQRVVFWEKGRDVAKVIGSTSATRGSLRFKPANGYGRVRTIEAQVFSYGHQRAEVKIARYTAPPLTKPGRPRHLKTAPAKGGALRVTWARAANAQQYLISVRVGDGARLIEFASANARSIVVQDVVPIKMATVTVTAELNTGLSGPSASVKFAQPKHRRKRHK
jgi:hypothetical protein